MRSQETTGAKLTEEENKSLRRWRTRLWKDENPDKVKEQKRQYVTRRKAKCLSQYGEICQCCGIDWPVFLVIDHINGGGNQHRREIGNGAAFYAWLIRNNFPPGFQVLCHNCNFAKHVKKVCPHQSTGGRHP